MDQKEPWQIWNELLSRPRTSLNAFEETIVRANVFLIDFEVGGWLYNLRAQLRSTANAIAQIGDKETSELLMEIAIILEIVSTDSQGTWEAFLTQADKNKRIPEIEKRISPKIELLYSQLEAFTREHFGCAS